MTCVRKSLQPEPLITTVVDSQGSNYSAVLYNKYLQEGLDLHPFQFSFDWFNSLFNVSAEKYIFAVEAFIFIFLP